MAAPVLVHLDLGLAVAVLLADVAGGVIRAVAGEGGRAQPDDGSTGDHGGGDDSTNRHWVLPFVAIDHSSVITGREQHPSMVVGRSYAPSRVSVELMFV